MSCHQLFEHKYFRLIYILIIEVFLKFLLYYLSDNYVSDIYIFQVLGFYFFFLSFIKTLFENFILLFYLYQIYYIYFKILKIFIFCRIYLLFLIHVHFHKEYLFLYTVQEDAKIESLLQIILILLCCILSNLM